MPRRVRYHVRFREDVERHSKWLATEGRAEWIPNLLLGIEQVIERITVFPEAGPRLAEGGRLVLRRLRFRRYPYVVWYAYRRRRTINEVWLLRLFGAHQDRPSPDPSSWTLAS